jgi:anti-sigma factor RsiW
MSQPEIQHEPDDELLSAYLDGELTADERAAVEARLASDPDSQQLLHKLRSVSQAVQRLPLETVGRDLSQQILHRAGALKPATSTRSDNAAAAPTITKPKITIFQTRRSWIWASLAVAAGLMIMVLQPAINDQADLPAVAQRDSATTANDKARQSLGRETSQPAPAAAIDPSKVATKAQPGPSRAATPLGSPSAGEATAQSSLLTEERPPSDSMAADKLAVTEGSAGGAVMTEARPTLTDVPSDEEIRAGRIAAAGPPSPPPGDRARKPLGEAVAPSAPPDNAPIMKSGARYAEGRAVQSSPTTARASAGQRVVAEEARAAALESQLNLPEALGELVVVHIIATPAAIQNKSLDDLLMKRGIPIEPEPASDAQQRAKDVESDVAKPLEKERPAAKSLNETLRPETLLDAVLVDAPSPTIVACLADLKKDEASFVGVEVQVPPADRDRTQANALTDKKQALDLTQFNRGSVSEKNKGLLPDAYYYRALSETEKAKGGVEVRGRLESKVDQRKSNEAVADTPTQLGATVQKTENTVRARRLARSELVGDEARESAARGGVAGAASVPGAMEIRRAQSGRTSPAGPPPDNMHVLFVVSAESAAVTSAPAKKSAE